MDDAEVDRLVEVESEVEEKEGEDLVPLSVLRDDVMLLFEISCSGSSSLSHLFDVQVGFELSREAALAVLFLWRLE